nr:hypothetical protein [Tanacetum cinerariifolium]
MDMTIDQQVALDEALVPHASRISIGKSNFHLRSDITSKDSTLQLVYLGHGGEIRKLTDVNINKLHEPWRSFTAVLNKCLSRKSTGYDSLRFTKVIIHFFMTKDPSIPKRNKANWHYVIDDQMFTMIKLVLRHQNTQQFSVMLPVELTNEDIRNSEAYKEYYAIASGAAPPKTKASVRKTKSSSDTTIIPLTVAGTRLSTSAKGKQPAKSSKAKGLSVLSEVAMTKAEQIKLATKQSPCNKLISPKLVDLKSSYEDDDDEVDDRSDDQEDDDDQDDNDQDDNDDDQNTDNDGDDFVHPKLSIHEEEAKDEESFDLIVQTPKNSDDEGNDDASLGLNVDGKEGHDAEDDDEELYRDVNINLEGRDSSSVSSQFVTSMHNPSPDAGIDSLFETTPQVDVQASTTVAPLTLTAPTLPPPTIPTISQVPQVPTPPITAPSTFLHDLLNFGSLFGFDHHLKTLEANFSEFMQTNQFARAVSSIPGIVKRYMDQRINEAVKVAIQIQSDRLRDEAQAKNEEFLNNIDESIQKIIKEQVKEQVKVQVFNILPKIEKTVNEQLKAEVLTRSSNSSKTSSDMKNPPLDQTGGPRGEKKEKSQIQQAIQRKRQPRPLARLLKGPNLIKRLQQQKKPLTLDRACNKTLPAIHENIQPWISDLAKQADSHSSFNELMDTPMDFLAFLMNQLKVDTLTPELLDGPTYELMKGSYKSLVELEFFLEEICKATTDQLDWNNPEGKQYPHNLLKPLPLIPNSRGCCVILFDHFINNDLEYLCGGASSRKYTTSVTKTKVADYRHIKWIEDLVPRTMWSQEPIGYDKYALWGISHWGCKRQQFYGFAVNRKSARDVYSKCRIIAITELQILPKEAQPHKARYDRSDLKRKEAYNAYSNPRGFIYQNKDKQNRLMQIDELHKFNDGTLNDVRTALDDRLKVLKLKLHKASALAVEKLNPGLRPRYVSCFSGPGSSLGKTLGNSLTTVPSQMTHLVASITLDSARSGMMQ